MNLRRFYVKPYVPESLKPLHELAYNVWTTWDHDAIRLFSRIDPALFRRVHHNPVEFMHRLGTERLTKLSKEPGFLFELEQVWYRFITYLSFEGTYQAQGGEERVFGPSDTIAYLSMEFSLHESIPIYSGGLGILAGDYLKAASDVGLPLVGFGLLYRFGYFTQRINPEDFQEEEYQENIWHLKAVEEVKDKDGQPVIIEVPLKKESISAKLWKIGVGRTNLYLLDTNIPQNQPQLRTITDMLYDAERDDRLVQELVLGRGSLLAMKRLGIKPKVFHLNEGHSAFIILERLRELIQEQGCSLQEASDIIRHSTVFTTHTPVIEGNEHFDEERVKQYLRHDLEKLNIPLDDFLAWGRVATGEPTFWLPALAMRFSRFVNGVSALHAEVSRKMWAPLFEGYHHLEIPIRSISNGVHLPTWLSPEMASLFDRYIGPDYLHQAESPEVWAKVQSIPDAELWEAHKQSKQALVSFVRRRLAEEMERKGLALSKIREVENVLNPRVLTIGFARRFAPYKRAHLILHDPERLAAIITDSHRPVQLIFAGKSHPADLEGKRIIRQVLKFIRSHGLEKQVAFIEDYDMDVGRHMTAGVDVWLNTPLKPMEASGTSGMKAGINGALHMSVLDGWWPECYDGQNGWAITAGDWLESPEAKLAAEANQIYELLEEEITRKYYDRSEGDLPRDWLAWMKNSIATVGKGFNMHRMLRGYLNDFYLPESETLEELLADDRARLKALGQMKAELDRTWPKVVVKDFFADLESRQREVGEELQVEAYVNLAGARPELFMVETVYMYGEEETGMDNVELKFVESYQDGVAKYTGALELREPGVQALGVRLRPADPLFRETYPGYIKWAG